jgi:sigma-B regulation protein RsbU (phosphoserine phosphatase)
MRRMGSSGDSENKRCRTPNLLVQLIGIIPDERAPLTQQIEDLGHRAELLEATDQGLLQALAHPGQIIIVEMASAGIKAADFCRQLRQSAKGKDCYALLLASSDQQSSALQAVDAGADDVLVKPLNAQTLRVHLNAATRMLILK